VAQSYHPILLDRGAVEVTDDVIYHFWPTFAQRVGLFFEIKSRRRTMMKMKPKGFPLLAAILCVVALAPSVSFADFTSGSTGADGDLIVNAPTIIQLPESGVLNYKTVNIKSGYTATFAKNSRNTPVTILASGDVLIDGTISVNGGNGGSLAAVGAGGPGGFDGGAGGSVYGSGYRALGPGGGLGGTFSNSTVISASNNSNYTGYGGGGGGFAGGGAAGNSSSPVGGNVGAGGAPYGNDGQLPMIGGSGGGGSGGNLAAAGNAGGGGGGAILIASSGKITVNGSITANGGTGGLVGNVGTNGIGGGGGSGGGIRLVANTITGNGAINASGGYGGMYQAAGGNGGAGRVRLEAWYLSMAQSNPYYTVVWNPTAVATPALPSLVISSVGGVAVPAIPKGDTRTPDIQLPSNTQNPVSIVVAAANVPIGTTVTVKASSTIGSTVNSASASLSGTDASSTTATVSLNLPAGSFPSLITVSTTYTAVASNGAPIYAEGERVDKIRVDTAMGGSSTLTYITASGREIPVKRS
jgi:hypothetical protein